MVNTAKIKISCAAENHAPHGMSPAPTHAGSGNGPFLAHCKSQRPRRQDKGCVRRQSIQLSSCQEPQRSVPADIEPPRAPLSSLVRSRGRLRAWVSPLALAATSPKPDACAHHCIANTGEHPSPCYSQPQPLCMARGKPLGSCAEDCVDILEELCELRLS